MTAETAFGIAFAIPFGLGLGIFCSYIFLGIDWVEIIHGPSKDEE